MDDAAVDIAVTPEQSATCDRFGVDPCPAPDALKVGIAQASADGVVNGLRHPPEGDTTGWFIWSGDYSDAADFFEPLHVRHLTERLPRVVPYLALPPGWRFLLAPNYEDVWYDAALLSL